MKEKCFRAVLKDHELFIPSSNIAAVALGDKRAILYLKYPMNERRKVTITDPTIAAAVSVWVEEMGGIY